MHYIGKNKDLEKACDPTTWLERINKIGMKANAIADLLKIPHSNFYKYLNGDRKPRPFVAIGIDQQIKKLENAINNTDITTYGELLTQKRMANELHANTQQLN